MRFIVFADYARPQQLGKLMRNLASTFGQAFSRGCRWFIAPEQIYHQVWVSVRIDRTGPRIWRGSSF